MEGCWLVSSTLNSRMVDSEAKPIGIAIHGSEIVNIQVNRNGATFLLPWHRYQFTKHYYSEGGRQRENLEIIQG